MSHSSISGKVVGYEGLYNFYNIGATSSSEPLGAIKNGLQYAKDGKGAGQEIKEKYLLPWNTKEKAITGGAIFLGSSYINVGQNTLYLQKFHVVPTNGTELFWHQYMTNVLAPYSESSSIYNGYVSTQILGDTMTFFIPVYNNMPENLCQNPNILESDFVQDNTKVYANVETTLHIRTGPSTSYESLIKIDKTQIMTRIAKGKQAGELWDKVLLSNGMVGYAFQNYLREVPSIPVEEIHLSLENTRMKKGERQTLQVEIFPPEAQNVKLEYFSSNPQVATIDSKGNILAIRAGKTNLSVSVQGSSQTAQIEVEVYTPLVDMQFYNQEFVMQEGDQFLLTPIFVPENVENPKVSYTSQKEEVASVDTFGNITAKKQGNTIIVAKAEENITREIQITVVEKIEEGKIVFDDSLRVEQNQITGWNLEEMQVEKIKEKIKTDYTIKIYREEQELEEGKTAGTGCKIQFLEENGEVKMEYFILLYGDVNGDGQINSIDLLKVQRHILELESLKGLFLKAGNINKNGKNPSSLDLLYIQRHILLLKEIEQ